jgi:hypothetical protein
VRVGREGTAGLQTYRAHDGSRQDAGVGRRIQALHDLLHRHGICLKRALGAAEFALRFGLAPVPRPPHWSGYRVAPLTMEFWRDRPFRLHDRLAFQRSDPAAPWAKTRLFP